MCEQVVYPYLLGLEESEIQKSDQNSSSQSVKIPLQLRASGLGLTCLKSSREISPTHTRHISFVCGMKNEMVLRRRQMTFFNRRRKWFPVELPTPSDIFHMEEPFSYIFTATQPRECHFAPNFGRERVGLDGERKPWFVVVVV